MGYSFGIFNESTTKFRNNLMQCLRFRSSLALYATMIGAATVCHEDNF